METSSSSGHSVDVDDLPIIALSRPAYALKVAKRFLDGSTDPAVRSLARQAAGIATRELGDAVGAVRQLRAALADAALVGPQRLADVESSLGLTLAFAGHVSEGLRHLDKARTAVTDAEAARVLVRRGVVLQIAGRPVEAIRDLEEAAHALAQVGDHLWEARAEVNLAQALIDCGQAEAADAALTSAEALLAAVGAPFESAVARENRGLVASLRGELPQALAHFDQAEKMYALAGARPPELSEVRCAVLLAAGLPSDALKSGQQAIELLRQRGAAAALRANALIRVADAALASDDPDLALRYARDATRLFAHQRRERGRVLARLRVVRARYAAGDRTPRLLRDATEVAGLVQRHGLLDVVEAHLLAGQVALTLAQEPVARKHLTLASKGRLHGSALNRVMGWHAAALRADASGRRRALYDCCERGLQILDAHQLTFGALETRAAATAHGASLALLALRTAVASDDARSLLQWSERWRATTSTLPPVRAPADLQLANDLEELRRVKLKLDQAIVDGTATTALDRRWRRLEREIRERTLREPGSAKAALERPSLDELLNALGGVQLVEIVRVDDTLHVLVASRSGIKHYVAGSWAKALGAAESARFALRRLARKGRSKADLEVLATVGAFLERTVLGPSVRDLGNGALVVAPPAALHPLPWGALPSLADQSVTVSPSAAAWLRASTINEPAEHSVGLIVGPALRSQGAEVAALADRYPGTSILTGQAASVASVMRLLDGCWLAHVAAHGSFRSDNPLFSSLQMHDGPLTMLDLQGVRRAPYRLVLSSCDSGSSAVTGADEMLGLFTALGPLGMAAMLAPVAPIDDEAAVSFSVSIHDRLGAGLSTADALRDARMSSSSPVDYVTARAFVAFGAA